MEPTHRVIVQIYVGKVKGLRTLHRVYHNIHPAL